MYKKTGLVFLITIFILISCKQQKKIDISKVFYIEYFTTDDSLKNHLNTVVNNKVTYYDEEVKIFRIIPKDYLTNETKDVHFLFSSNELKTPISENTQKYRIDINDSLPLRNTAFAIKKYKYQNGNWILKYDLGYIKVQLLRYRFISNDKLRNDVSIDIVNTIAKDTYSF